MLPFVSIPLVSQQTKLLIFTMFWRVCRNLQFPKRTVKNYIHNYFLSTEVKPNSFLQCVVLITGTKLPTIHATCVTDAAR